MWKQRTLETVGMLLIGDGIAAALEPRRHARLWLGGPRGWRRAMRYFARTPELTRCVGMAEAGLGLWLTHRQRPD